MGTTIPIATDAIRALMEGSPIGSKYENLDLELEKV